MSLHNQLPSFIKNQKVNFIVQSEFEWCDIQSDRGKRLLKIIGHKLIHEWLIIVIVIQVDWCVKNFLKKIGIVCQGLFKVHIRNLRFSTRCSTWPLSVVISMTVGIIAGIIVVVANGVVHGVVFNVVKNSNHTWYYTYQARNIFWTCLFHFRNKIAIHNWTFLVNIKIFQI